MPITIGSNIAALQLQRQLGKSSQSLSAIFQRLASGQRINKSRDDSAGLAVASNLNVDKRVFTQGLRNFNDGISMLNIAEGATRELTGIAIRIKELATQSASGVLSYKRVIVKCCVWPHNSSG